MEANDNKAGFISDHVAAIPTRGVEYGFASAVDVAIPYRPSVTAPTIPQQLRFYLGELTGLLFVVLSTLFILAMPAGLTRRGEVSAWMNRIVKRTIDILGAGVGIILTAPIMLLLAVLVKLDSCGPVFYTQTRVGMNRRKGDRRLGRAVSADNARRRERRREDVLGRPFSILKFRTMVVDAERGSGPVWASKNDPRVTRLGRILRKTRMDEIPQFFSVLKGDMSLVGPRPERPTFVADLSTQIDNYTSRLQVKPGITGLAQIENGYDSSLQSVTRKVQYDLEYIRRWSVLSDIRILAKTVVVVLTGKGAC
ncbi:MAG: sugar transferase [candidate division Zixibacteria bacterium]|nr:sugar transferase [candidate division Zixibacteria bacterium]